MTRTTMANYHVQKDECQAFERHAGGIVGNLISPELAPTKVHVADVRTINIGTFADTLVGFKHAVTDVESFEDAQTWRPPYDAELKQLLQAELNAKEVIVFDHTVRIDDPDADRKPARNVHSDYTQNDAEHRLVDLLCAKGAADWAEGHYAFINIWRPIEAQINPAPLGFIVPDRGQPSVAHSALDMTEDPSIHTVRKSIESRTLVRY